VNFLFENIFKKGEEKKIAPHVNINEREREKD
jgi:hypothetical protein